MAKKYMLDTCIWMNFYEARLGSDEKPFGNYAYRLYLKILKEKGRIIFSQVLMGELNEYYDKEEVNDMLNFLFGCGVLIRVNVSNEDYAEALALRKNRKVPFPDCLLALQAQRYDAILVTRDNHFFNELKDILKAVKPESIS